MPALDELIVTLTADTSDFNRGITAAESSVRRFEDAAERGLTNVERLANRSLSSAGQQAQRVGASFSGMSGQMRAALTVATFQIQDVITQVQTGTNALRAISVQLPQALGAFGFAGAIIGTVAGAVLSLSGALFNLGGNLDGTSKKVKDFAEELEKLARKAVDAAKRTGDFALAVRALDEEARIFAIRNLRQELAQLEEQLSSLAGGAPDRLRDFVGELQRELERMRRLTEQFNVDLAQNPQALENFRIREELLRELNSLLQQFDAGSIKIGEFTQQLDKLAERFSGFPVLKELADQLGASGTEATALRLRIEELRAELKILEEGTKPAETAVDRLNREIEKSEEAAKSAAEGIKRLEKAHIDYLKSVEVPRPRPFSQGVPIPQPRPFNLRSDRGFDEVSKKLAQEQINVLKEADVWWGRIRSTAEDALTSMIMKMDDFKEIALSTLADIHEQLVRTFLTRPIVESVVGAFQGAVSQFMFPSVVQAAPIAAPGAPGIGAGAPPIPFGQLLPSSFLNFPLLTTTLPAGSAHAAGVMAVPGGLLNAPTTVPAFTVGNALTAFGLGFTGGSFIGSFFGEPMRGGVGGGLGAIAGAALGSVIPGLGTAIGGLIGGGLGTGLGILSGGGQSKNQANIVLDLGTGRKILEDQSPGAGDPNRQAVRALAEEVRGLIRFLRVDLGVQLPSFQQKITVSRTQTPEEEEADIVREIRSRLTVDDALIRQVIQKSSATTIEDLLSELELAKSIRDFEEGTTSAKFFLRELAQLRSVFDELRFKAESLGLSLQTVAEMEERAIEELLRTAEDAVLRQRDFVESFFQSRIQPIESVQQAIRFGPATALSPVAQFREMESLFQEIASKALAGQESAVQQLPQIAQQFILEAREFGASGPLFQEVFRQVNLVLNQVLDQQRRMQEDVLGTLPDDLRAANRDVVEELKKQTEEIVRELIELRKEIERTRRAS